VKAVFRERAGWIGPFGPFGRFGRVWRGFRGRPRGPLAGALSSLAVAIVFSGCVTYIPVDEYNLARAAYEAARDADAPRYAPSLWFNAEQAYRDGQKSFKERNFGDARYKFTQTRNYAEQAENAARLARHQSGDVVP
jgi:hypothetical protein